jgi:hypothetical protein
VTGAGGGQIEKSTPLKESVMFDSGLLPVPRRRFLAAAGLGTAALPGVALGTTGPGRPPRGTLVSDRGGEKTYLLVFDKGEEVMGGLLAFAKEQGLVGGHLSGIGAVSNAPWRSSTARRRTTSSSR